MRQTHEALAADMRVPGVPEFAPSNERLAHGRVTIEPIIDMVRTGERGRHGDGKGATLRPVVMGYVRRAVDAELDERLARFKDLPQAQVEAAKRYERTWNLTGLEPRMTANYAGSSGGGKDWAALTHPSESLPALVYDARTAHHDAQNVLMAAGSLEVCRVVDAIVLAGEPAHRVGACRYPTSRPQALAHVRANLDIGLGLLVAHYAVQRIAKPAADPVNDFMDRRATIGVDLASGPDRTFMVKVTATGVEVHGQGTAALDDFLSFRGTPEFEAAVADAVARLRRFRS